MSRERGENKMFNVDSAELQYIFDSAGQTVIINDIKRQAIITNPAVNEFEERYLHTLDKTSMGDLVTIDDENYLIITETVLKRHGKFKSLIRHCNYFIQFAGETHEEPLLDENGNIVYDEFGEPITITVEGEPYFIPAIVENKSFTILGSQILVADNQMIVIVQDNKLNRTKFAVNGTFNVMDKSWKVLNDDRTKKGLITLSCEIKV